MCSVPYIIISYEKLLTRTVNVVTQIAKFLGVPFNEQAVEFVDAEVGYRDVEAFI